MEESKKQERKKLLKILLITEDDDILDLIQNEDDEDDINILSKFIPKIISRKVKIKNYVEKVVPQYSNEDFRVAFRVNKRLFENLVHIFESNSIYVKLRQDKRFSAEKHLYIFLWFAGHEGCSFRDLADRFDASISSICRIINRVLYFLSNLSNNVICWPNAPAMNRTSCLFYSKYGFPNVIGAIDGSHIIIDPPKQGKDDYINRKGNFSVVLQAICDERRKFIDIFVGFPGSVHDSRVFRNSPVYDIIENKLKDFFILGDSAYPLMNSLMTPYKDNGHLTRSEKEFNRKLSSCRVVVEHSFGILKQRFRQLYYCKLRGAKKINNFIRACCVLHNLANEDDLPFVINEDELNRTPLRPDEENTSQLSTAKAIRDKICRGEWRTQLSIEFVYKNK